jgi:hypothetical protein
MNNSPTLSALGFPRFALIFAALFGVASVPVLLCDITLPLFDYPNHLARMHILIDLAHSPELQRFYEVVWRPVPNLAMDAVVPVLTHFMPLAWAGKSFVLLTLFLIAGGAAALNRVLFGGWSAWPCLAFLLLYNRFLLWGFLNYLFGIGLALFAFAFWIALGEKSAAPRLAVGALFALLLFFAHLLAFGLYGVMVMGYATGLVLRRRRRVAELFLAAAPFLPPLAILFLASPGAVAGAVRFGPAGRKLDLLFSVFDNYHRIFDISSFVFVALALLFAFVRRWARLAPDMLVPLGLLVLVYLAMPNQLATASGADHRIPLLFDLVFIAGSRWEARLPRAQRRFLGAALVLFLLRLGLVSVSWQASERTYANLLPALDLLPEGSLVAVAYPPEAVNSEATPLAHFPTLAVLRRDVFVPTLFAASTQQPVALRPFYRALADRLPPERLWEAFLAGAALDQNERAALAAYQYIFFVGRTSFERPAVNGLESLFTAPRFALFRIMPATPRLDDASAPR